MFIDEERLKPYLDAVKQARIARRAVRQVSNSEEEALARYLRADAEYLRACRALAEIAEACVQGA